MYVRNNYTVADLGDGESFVPKAGFMGTLPPGETFEQMHPIDKLSTKVT
jgi:hypothetical protein